MKLANTVLPTAVKQDLQDIMTQYNIRGMEAIQSLHTLLYDEHEYLSKRIKFLQFSKEGIDPETYKKDAWHINDQFNTMMKKKHDLASQVYKINTILKWYRLHKGEQ